MGSNWDVARCYLWTVAILVAHTREPCWQRVHLMRTTTCSILRKQLCPLRVLKIGSSSCKASPTVWGGLKPVIMSDHGQALLKAVPLVFGKENHAYCLRYLAENFLQVAGKHGNRKEATKHQGNVIPSSLCPNPWRVQCRGTGAEGIQAWVGTVDQWQWAWAVGWDQV